MKSILAIFIILFLLGNSPIMSYASSENITKIYQIKCTNKSYDIVFSVSNATVTDLKQDDANAGIFIPNSTNGKISVYVPTNVRTTFSSSVAEYYGDVIILFDGRIPSANSLNSTHQISSMNLPDGNFTAQVSVARVLEGNYPKDCSIVPEFDSLAIMVITISIIGSILIQRRLYH